MISWNELLEALLQGLTAAFGFFFGIFFLGAVLIGLVVYLIKKRKRHVQERDFEKKLLIQYAEKLEEREKYEELQKIQEFIDRMQDGEDIKDEFLKNYKIKKDFDINVDDGSFSFESERRIVKKKG